LVTLVAIKPRRRSGKMREIVARAIVDNFQMVVEMVSGSSKYSPLDLADAILKSIHSEMVGLVKGLDTFNILEEDDGVLTDHLLSAIEKKFK